MPTALCSPPPPLHLDLTFARSHRLGGFDLDVPWVTGHHSVHTAFNLLELERLISKMAMTQKKFLL